MILIASINNFARLYPVTPTWAWEEITVAMEICDAWFGKQCDFEVKFDENGGTTSPFTLTNIPLNHYTGDIKLFYFTIPANTFAISGRSDYYVNIGISAKATIKDTDNSILGYSNELQLDLMYIDDFHISNLTSIINRSSYKINMYHRGYSSFNLINSDMANLNSYQVKLYNSNMDLVFESEIMSDDWNNFYYLNWNYQLKNLQNNTDYKLKIIGTLFNGFQVETPVYSFRVEYSEPAITSDLHLTNIETTGAIQINQTFDANVVANKVKISRSVHYENDWIEIYNGTREPSITRYDYMGLYGVQYDYKLDLYQDNTFVAEYINTITSKFQGMVVADKYNHFSTLISPDVAYSKTFNANTVNTLGSQRAFVFYNGITNHYKGNISCTVHNFNNDNCTLNFDNYALFRIAFIDFLTNKCEKILKRDDGTGRLIGIIGEPSCSESENDTAELAKCSFEWTENYDVNNSQDYVTSGLV